MIKKITKKDKEQSIGMNHTRKQYSNCSIIAFIENNKCHVIYQFKDNYAKQEDVSISAAFNKLHHYGPDAIKQHVDMAE